MSNLLDETAEYSIFKGYFYLYKVSHIIGTKHLVIDTLQDSILKCSLGTMLEGVSSYFINNHKDNYRYNFCPHCNKDVLFCKDLPNQPQSNVGQHKHDFYDELKFHGIVKFLGIVSFPIYYYFQNNAIFQNNNFFIFDYVKTAVKYLGINPMEAIYAVHTASSYVVPDSYNALLTEYESYVHYESFKNDQQHYKFLQEFDLFMEALDGFIHTKDNLELFYAAAAVPEMILIGSGLLGVYSLLYLNTEIYDNFFASQDQ